MHWDTEADLHTLPANNVSFLAQVDRRVRYDWQRSHRLIVASAASQTIMAVVPLRLVSHTHWFFANDIFTLFVVTVGMLSATVSAIVQYDSAVDAHAFWRMHAVNPMALLTAKVATLAATMWALPVMLGVIDGLVGYPSILVASPMRETVKLLPLLTLLLIGACALTRTYKSVLLLAIVTLILLILFERFFHPGFSGQVDQRQASSAWRNIIIAIRSLAIGGLTVLAYFSPLTSQKWAVCLLITLAVPLLAYVFFVEQGRG